MILMLWDMIWDAFMDTIKLLPFLFLTYVAMEYLERKVGRKTERAVGRAGYAGPALGAVCGIFPQCGFSAAASNLYAGRMITMGTLLAVFLSTSDEMLPILLSEQVNIQVIFKLLGLKVIFGMLAGYLTDFALGGQRPVCRKGENVEGHRQGHSCHIKDACRCEEGVFRPAARHTVQVFGFIFLFSLALNALIGLAGEDFLAGLFFNRPVVGPLLAGLVGLVPNCAASVALTEFYLEGLMGLGPMVAGLLVGSGVGLLVLFRVNHNGKENMAFLLLLYVFGVAAGILLDAAGLAL